MQVTIDEDGETRVRERFVVSAPVAGRLQRIELEPGDPVVRGKTVVARLTAGRRAAARSADARRAGGRGRGRARRRRTGTGRARSRRRRADARADDAPPARDAAQGRAPSRATSSRPPQTTLQDGRGSACARRSSPSRAREHELQLARARLQAVERRRRNRRRRRAGRRRRAEAAARERVGRAGRASRCSRSATRAASRSSPTSCRPTRCASSRGDAGAHRAVGRQPIRLHGRVRRVEPSGFMKVSALGVEEQRVNVLIDFVDADRAAAAGLGDGYRVEVRVVVWRDDAVAEGAGRQPVPARRGLGGVRRRGRACPAADGASSASETTSTVRSSRDCRQGRRSCCIRPTRSMDGARVVVRGQQP